MRKTVLVFAFIIVFAAVCGGCASMPAAASATPVATAATAAPSPTYSPVPTTPPEQTPEVKGSDEQDETNSVTLDGKVYYLDVNDPVAADYSEDPPLRVKNTDGSSDMALGIRGFQFDIIGSYIYVDSNDPDLSSAGEQTWSTTRMNLDGSGKQMLEYANMSSRLVPQGEQKFYFTTLGDSAIYISDFACENVTTVIVELPDRSELDRKLDKNKILNLSIDGVADGAINFKASFVSQNGTELYNGTYKISADGSSIEKIKGTYYYYSSQNEAD